VTSPVIEANKGIPGSGAYPISFNRWRRRGAENIQEGGNEQMDLETCPPASEKVCP
jgi:hypothetical protein